MLFTEPIFALFFRDIRRYVLLDLLVLFRGFCHRGVRNLEDRLEKPAVSTPIARPAADVESETAQAGAL